MNDFIPRVLFTILIETFALIIVWVIWFSK